MITSLANDKVKLARGLAERRRMRWQERAFIMEGTRLLRELARHAVQPQLLFYTESAQKSDEGAALIEAFAARGVPCYQVSDAVMAACSDTVAPPGLLAVVPFPDIPPPAGATWALVVDNVRTPGNLGAILRTAAAAGVEQVLLSPGTVDLYNPKVVRGAAGVHLHLPIFPLSWDAIGTRLQGFTVWLAAPGAALAYTEVDWRGPVALLMGGEARGASEPAQELADGLVTVPMARGVESLNVAVATGVLLFEIARQRRVFGRNG